MRSPRRAKALRCAFREEGMSGRKDLPLLRVYASEQAHSSIDKGIITSASANARCARFPLTKTFAWT
jgi:aromatic-L-amino-acid decarboxylase